jgi:hypothetical protein
MIESASTYQPVQAVAQGSLELARSPFEILGQARSDSRRVLRRMPFGFRDGGGSLAFMNGR